MSTRKKKPAKRAPLSRDAASRAEAAPHAYDLDRVLHEKARLSIVVALLARPDGVLFPQLKELCALTDGNLSRHLSMLQEHGIVEIWKRHEGARGGTLLRLSSEGRAQLVVYLEELDRVLRDARTSGSRASDTDLGPEWMPA